MILAGSFGYEEQVWHPWQRNLGWLCGRFPPLRNKIGRGIMFLDGRHRGHLLDVGCGAGTQLSLMRRLGWEVTGVEPAAEAAAIARERLCSIAGKIGFTIVRCDTAFRFDKWVQGWIIQKAQRFDPLKLELIFRRKPWRLLAYLIDTLGSRVKVLGDEVVVVAVKKGVRKWLY